MKKLILASLLVALSASTSFAAATATAASDLTKAGLNVKSGTATVGKLSTGVVLAWNTDTNGYVIITAHKSGVKQLGSGHDSTAIMSNTFVSTTAIAAPSAASASSVVGAGWTAL